MELQVNSHFATSSTASVARLMQATAVLFSVLLRIGSWVYHTVLLQWTGWALNY